MARKVNTDYPEPYAVQETVLRNTTSLDGARRFYAAEHVLVFASERVGLAQASGEVWLRPSAARRMGSYLDLAQRPAVAGFRLQRHPAVKPLPGATPDSLLEHFSQVSEEVKREEVSGSNRIRLEHSCIEAGEAWSWHGTLSYEHVFAMAGGERIANEAPIILRARETANGDVDIAAVLRRPREFEMVSAWVHRGLAPSKQGWLVSPIGLPAEPADRASAFTRLLSGFEVGDPVGVAHPDIHPRERPTDEPADPERNPFLDVLTQAPYRTKLAGLDVILDRVRADDGILGGLHVTLWAKQRRNESTVVQLQLKHRPRTDDHLEVRWNGGRELSTSEKPTLDELNWESMPSIDWGDEAKMQYTVDAWGDVVKALLDTTATSAATAPAGQLQPQSKRGA